HSTGRSAAVFNESYGNGLIRDLTRASRPFFQAPPPGFAEVPLLRRRGVLHTARRRTDLDTLMDVIPPAERELQTLDQAQALFPILRREGLVGAVFARRPSDIDVDALLGGYLRRFKANDGALLLGAQVLGLTRLADGWRVETSSACLHAPLIVNAAGAWASQIAALAGAHDIGLQTLKRTALLLDAPPGLRPDDWPMLKDAGEQYYLKPDAGRLLLSPCDEEPAPPGDVQADEMTIAIAVDRIEQATTLQVRRVSHRWAGLRSFVADRSPVVGFDPLQPGFFWLAALGGYGIQTAPALSRLAAQVALGVSPDDDASAEYLRAMTPHRLTPR
ncbi:MAG: FAD-binding oxidoreductase, partial [Proteobacteria bacterium]|nr:FAD-binding oxidoreductase [Pseudomonadota bacterium]